MPNPNEIAKLLFKHLRDELTPEEEIVLNSWKVQSPENESDFNELTDPDQVLEMLKDLHNYKESTWNIILARAPELRPDPIAGSGTKGIL